jgi:hypothetical protein
MSSRRVFAFTVSMAVGTGCPETWREGGTIDRAMSKDLAEELHRHDCSLSEAEWKRTCAIPARWERDDCPHECQFRADP